MAYAPHHNGEIFNGAGRQVRPRLIAAFRHAETDVLFEVADRFNFVADRDMSGNWSRAILPHYVYVGDGEPRMALVLKTVAYIAVDEDARGNPVLEKWKIKRKREYAS